MLPMFRRSVLPISFLLVCVCVYIYVSVLQSNGRKGGDRMRIGASPGLYIYI
jgi:hypothetical protein